jgi:hypothetical protein
MFCDSLAILVIYGCKLSLQDDHARTKDHCKKLPDHLSSSRVWFHCFIKVQQYETSDFHSNGAEDDCLVGFGTF